MMAFQRQLTPSMQSVDLSLIDLIVDAIRQSDKFATLGPINPNKVTLYSDVGNNKRVYKVDLGIKSFIAVGLPREEEYDLFGEFKTLEKLWKEVPEYFPEPYFFYEGRNQYIMAMEFFPHSTIGDVKPLNHREEAQTAYQIGFALGITYQRTGMINEEPHDNNVLVDMDGGEITIKLIDAAHYREGTLHELIELACEQQELCREYKPIFKNGLRYGRNEA